MIITKLIDSPSSPSLRVERDDCVRQLTDSNQGE